MAKSNIQSTMKTIKLALYALLLVLLMSCASTRQTVVDSNTTKVVDGHVDSVSTTKQINYTDSSFNDDKEMIITEIEFTDTTDTSAVRIRNGDIGVITNNKIKRIKITRISHRKAQNSIKLGVSDSKTDKMTNLHQDVREKVKSSEKHQDPYKLRYTFYLVLLIICIIVGLILYIRGSPILSKVMSLFIR